MHELKTWESPKESPYPQWLKEAMAAETKAFRATLKPAAKPAAKATKAKKQEKRGTVNGLVLCVPIIPPSSKKYISNIFTLKDVHIWLTISPDFRNILTVVPTR
jgi:hypothetical protein